MPAPPTLGKVASWDDARGYGFIVPLERRDGQERLFFHVRDYAQAGRRPEIDELVRFVPNRQPDGRWQASHVVRTATAARGRAGTRAQRRHPTPTMRARRGGTATMLLLVAGWAATLGWAVGARLLPVEAPLALLALNVLTFAMYAIDKRAAQTGRWRTPESQLHLLELLGGWPAAWLGQRWLRHKSAKRGYRLVFWSMIVLHLLALAVWLAA